MVAEQSSLFRRLTWIAGGRRLGGSLVTSFCRRRGAEHNRSPEMTGRCPIERTFGGMKNDCSWKPTRDPAQNTSCILRGAQGSWPLTLRAGLGVPNWLRLSRQRRRDATCPIEGCLGGPRQPATWLPRGGPYKGNHVQHAWRRRRGVLFKKEKRQLWKKNEWQAGRGEKEHTNLEKIQHKAGCIMDIHQRTISLFPFRIHAHSLQKTPHSRPQKKGNGALDVTKRGAHTDH